MCVTFLSLMTSSRLSAMRRHRLCWNFTFLLACGPADAATFSVGADAACTHSDIGTAIAEAATNGAPDVIVLARPSFDDVELLIDGDQVELRGGFAACDATSATSRTELRGRDALASRVLTLRNQGRGRPIELSDLNIVRSVGALGGGIAMVGSQEVELRLVRTTVSGHRAIRGAGIDMEDPLVAPKLLKLIGSEISGNVADAGGGVYCHAGAVELTASSRMTGNHAEYGGALAGRFCQVRLIGDSSTGMRGNTAAVHGGAVFLAEFGLFSAMRRPGAVSGPLIADNTAGGNGGAVYLGPGQFASFSDAIVRGNQAGDSGGVVFGVSSRVRFDRGSQPCEVLECGVIANNRAGINLVTEGRGGVVALTGNSVFDGFHRQVIVDNLSRRGSVLFCECGFIDGVWDSLVARNSGAEELFWLDSSAELRILGTTLADNRNLEGLAGDRTRSVWIDHSILADPLPLVVRGGQGATTTLATCSILDSGAPPSMQESGVSRVDDPGFVAPLLGDYSLRDDSLAIDFCAAPVLSSGIDLSGSPRGVVFRSNLATRFDVGAFERNPLFADGFEG